MQQGFNDKNQQDCSYQCEALNIPKVYEVVYALKNDNFFE